MKKSICDKEGWHHLIDARTIQEKPQHFLLTATAAERQALAQEFDVPDILSLTADILLFRDDIIHLEGSIQAEIKQQCVVTNEIFSTALDNSFVVFFTEGGTIPSDEVVLNLDEEPIEPLTKGKINLWEVLREQFGLALPLFPKKTQTPFEYHDPQNTQDDDTGTHPFSALKHLLDSKKKIIMKP